MEALAWKLTELLPFKRKMAPPSPSRDIVKYRAAGFASDNKNIFTKKMRWRKNLHFPLDSFSVEHLPLGPFFWWCSTQWKLSGVVLFLLVSSLYFSCIDEMFISPHVWIKGINMPNHAQSKITNIADHNVATPANETWKYK